MFPLPRISSRASFGAKARAAPARDPERGFALQRVYTADRSLDESVAAHDGDVVLVPRGFHTVSAPPGYEVYYLNVMAGPRREWKVTFDPDHERLR